MLKKKVDLIRYNIIKLKMNSTNVKKLPDIAEESFLREI